MVELGKHKVTAITRRDSTTQIPSGVEVKKVDYNEPASLAEALQGQDALIITMGVEAPPDQHNKLVDAAAAAKVPWIMPNGYGYDLTDTSAGSAGKDTMLAERVAKYRAHIEELGISSWVNLECGFWYEYSLSSGPSWYGFDLKNRTATFVDEGDVPLNTSTWPQCGRAVANLFALKLLPDNETDKSPCLAQFRNKSVYISSFRLTQRDMLESLLRVTGTTVHDWKIKHEPHKERFEAGVKLLQEGNRYGFPQLLYTRMFYPDRSGDHESSKGLQNKVLDLPTEDLDYYTKVALDMEPIEA